MNIGFIEFNNQKIEIQILNGKIQFIKENTKSFNHEEQKLISKIKEEISINKRNSIFIKKVKLSKNYSLYYDKKSKNYFWIPEDNIYNENDNKLLNFKYNHQEEILAYDKIENLNSKNFYKKLINFENKTLILFIVSTIALSFNFSSPKVEASEQSLIPTETVLIEETKSPEIIYVYDYNDIEESINKNPYLSEEEKSIIKSTKFIFDENYMYMNIPLVLSRLETLKIEYSQEYDNRYTAGTYNPIDNIIRLRNKSIKGALQEFIHEYLHVLQTTYNSFLMELSNQFFTNEVIMRLYEEHLIEDYYFYDNMANSKIEKGEDYKSYSGTKKMSLLARNNTFDRGYMGYVSFYYILVELLPQEVIREFQFNPANIEILFTSLEEIEPEHNFLKAFDVILSISELRLYNEEIKSWEYQKDVSKAYYILNDFYLGVKGKNITDEPEVFLNYIMDKTYMSNKFDVVEEEYDKFNEFIRGYTGKYNVIRLPKTYLSNIRKNSILVYKNEYNEDSELTYINVDNNFLNEYYEYIKNNNINNNNNMIKQMNR